MAIIHNTSGITKTKSNTKISAEPKFPINKMSILIVFFMQLENNQGKFQKNIGIGLNERIFHYYCPPNPKSLDFNHENYFNTHKCHQCGYVAALVFFYSNVYHHV